MFTQIRHVAIHTENHFRMANFYKTLFGMKKITAGMTDENGNYDKERGHLSDGIIGKEGRKYVPLFGSLFIFILLANILGLVPGFAPPTSNFFTNLGLGLVVFVAYNYFGVREHGAKYFKQFMGPMLLLAPLFILIEFFSHVFRPISLSIRLFGNMFGDHLVLEIFSELTKVVIPVVFYILGALVSVIQAAVFTILSVIYVAMAISHEH